MKNNPSMKIVLCLFLASIMMSCNKDNDEEIPSTGLISGVVTALETGAPLEDVRITVFNANTNAPAGATLRTDSVGSYSIELVPGTYLLKLDKSGFEGIPGPGLSALPMNVTAGNTTPGDFEMTASAISNGGVITGRVTANGSNSGGALVIAENVESAFSSVTDANGEYYIVNVPPGNYTVAGWYGGHNSSVKTANVDAGSELNDVNLELTANAGVTVSGSITFLATQNIEVDVSLVHPKTKETIPGLTTATTGSNYAISGVPQGTFLGRASFENDKKVIDPDWIVKNGEPVITVLGSDITLNYSVTGAVSLASPTNDLSSTQPVEVSAGGIQFSWDPYPSSSDFVIEVMNANGTVIWGGFSEDWSVRNVIIPGSETSVAFNFDGSASGDLEAGKVYRWRIYASKDDNQSATGWRLISVSEDQTGLIRIAD